jgi:aldehyde:ferredoxin oxidoreductase
MHVCSGKLLLVDLNTGKTNVAPVSEDMMRQYFLGSGLAARLYMDLDKLPEPLAPGAPLYIMTGLFTGSMASCACRTIFCGRSPLTGIWNESTAGGYFGAELRSAGWDGMIITGRSSQPVVLWIENDRVELMDADAIWGAETLAGAEATRKMTDPKAQVAVIGPAGERGVPMANIMLGGRDCRAAGRGGMGAVMGAKNLKAIAVRGAGRPGYAEPERMRQIVKETNRRLRDAYVGLSNLGTGGGLANAARAGDMPVKNWAGGDWSEGAARITGAAMADRELIVRSYRCHGCPVGCTQHITIPAGPYAGGEGHAPEYETLAGFGGNCLNDDLDSIITANERCNRLGLDTISVSAAIAFAMEAAERGLLDHYDAAPAWGDRAAILQLVEDIAAGAALGAWLGQGVRAAARELGDDAAHFAPHVKGMELPYHDPRAEMSMSANYATGNRGACHLASTSYAAMWGFEIEDLYKPAEYDAHSSIGKGRMAAEWQNFMSAINALGVCKLVCKSVITPRLMASWLRAGFGWDIDWAEVVQVGERIFTVQRQINGRLGVTAADDVLPARFTVDARPDGGSAGALPDMELLMSDYYQTRGWDANGYPTQERLTWLGLA